MLSRSIGFVTYSLALASASRDDVSTCGLPRGQLMSRQRAVSTVHSFMVWIIAVACWYACAKLSVVRSLPELQYGGNCLELTSGRVWTIFKIVNILCEMIYCWCIIRSLNSWILPSHSTILPATTCRADY